MKTLFSVCFLLVGACANSSPEGVGGGLQALSIETEYGAEGCGGVPVVVGSYEELCDGLGGVKTMDRYPVPGEDGASDGGGSFVELTCNEGYISWMGFDESRGYGSFQVVTADCEANYVLSSN